MNGAGTWGVAVSVSAEGGSSPARHSNGREIFFFMGPANPASQPRMMAVAFTPGSPPTTGRPVEVFSYDPGALGMACTPTRCYDVAAGGQRFYAVQTVASPPSPPVRHINPIQNWFEELKAKVPTRR